MRKIRWDVLALFAGAVLFAFVARFLTFHNLPHFSAKVEAQSPQRLKLQSKEKIGDFYTEIRCDSETGNLQYLSYWFNGLGSPVNLTQYIVSNGCTKNSH